MTEDPVASREPVPVPTVGEYERHLAVSSVAQQGSQVVASLTALVSITVLARHLPLDAFGTYGLLVSLTAYVLFLQGSVEAAAVKALAEARNEDERTSAFSTAVTLYLTAGVAAGGLVAGGGTALLALFQIPAGLHDDAQTGIFALAVVTCAGWPLKVFNDQLRGAQRFVLSALAEMAAYVTLGATLVALTLAAAPLWLLVAVGASAQPLIGATSAGVVLAARLGYRYRPKAVTRASVHRFLSLSSYLSLAGVSGVVIYALDRTILASFRSAATVGLYEGPVRAHNLVQQVHSTLAIPVLPASSRLVAEDDERRIHDLLLRGTRYTLAAVVPLAIVFMALARPILRVWLGPRYGAAATAMTVLVGYWLVNANTGVASSMLVSVGRARRLATYAVAVAVLNLVLSLALTPSLGLNGVVLGTTISYVVSFPFFLKMTLSALPVTLREFASEAWLPAYLSGAVVAAALIAVRLTLPLDQLWEVVAAALLALAVYWGIYFFAWLRPSERLLVKDIAFANLRR